MPLGAAPGAAPWTSLVRGSARRHDRAPFARTGSPRVTTPTAPKGRIIGASGATTMTTVSRGLSHARSFVGLRARGPLAPLPAAAADALNGASPSQPPADAPKLYPNLDLDFVPAMTPAEWARGAAVAALAALLHAALVAKLLSRKLADAGAPWHVAAAPTVAIAALVFLLHRYVTLEAKEQARLISERDASDADSLFEPMDAAGDVRVHYKLRRPPSRMGPPRAVVACCHGFGANAWSWERGALAPLAKALDAAVVAHDSPGFGLTSRPRDLKWYVPNANAEIARRMLDVAGRAHQSLDERAGRTAVHKAGKVRRVVVGHSMGGIAAAIAAGAGDVDDVVLVAPALVPPRARTTTTTTTDRTTGQSDTAAGALIGALRRFLTASLAYAFAPFLKVILRVFVRSARFWRNGLAKAVGRGAAPALHTDLAWADGYRRPSCVRGWDDGMARVVIAACTGGVNDVWANESKRVARAFKGAEDAEGADDRGATDAGATLDALRASGARVLIVHGDEDSIVPLANSRRLAEALPGAELAVMGGCGHMPHEEDPDAFVDLVKSFVEGKPVS